MTAETQRTALETNVADQVAVVEKLRPRLARLLAQTSGEAGMPLVGHRQSRRLVEIADTRDGHRSQSSLKLTMNSKNCGETLARRSLVGLRATISL